MKNIIKYMSVFILTASLVTGCNSKHADNAKSGEKGQKNQLENVGEDHSTEEGMNKVHLSELKFKSLGMKVGKLPSKNVSEVVEANGQLEVLPQERASVTAILGANIINIFVIEGEHVKKGQKLATLAHPTLAQLQISYVRSYNQMLFLEKQYQRYKTLYEEEVGSGQQYQQTLAEYKAMKGEVEGYEAQLHQLNINEATVREGTVYEKVSVVSPISGYVNHLNVQLGQFVDPQTEMFSIVNADNIHVALKVFEKDVYKVKIGQKIIFTVEAVPGEVLSGKVFSVSKQFEQNPKAVHVHASINERKGVLVPGMYVNAKIHVGGQNQVVKAVPEEAIIEEEGKSYLFSAEKHNEEGATEWVFSPMEVRRGTIDEGWVEIKLLEPFPDSAKAALNNAYYLISEMKKGSKEHGH